MKRKFILIDQSIKNSGGHHLEYALRVLKAAKLEGFETVLAVNKTCESFSAQDVDVIDKAYTHTFWENLLCKKSGPPKPGKSVLLRLARKWNGWKHKLAEKKADFAYDLTFSQAGMAHTLLSEGQSTIQLMRKYRSAGAGQEIGFWPIVFATMYLGWRHTLDRLRPQVRTVTGPFSRVTSLLARFVRLIGSLIKAVLVTLISPLILVYVIFTWKKTAGTREDFIGLFEKETPRFLRRIGARDGDVVFVPTLSDVELAAIGACSHNAEFSGLSWHLLFRRNLFNGREPAYLTEMQTIKGEHLELAEFKQKFKYGKAFFYTDTVVLTEQYNMFGVYPFVTLPIPHDETLRRMPSKQPLVVSYIGDARDEKGFGYLAKLVGDLRAAGYGEDRLRFRFQSNFNTPLGDIGPRMAKAELASLPESGVELLEGPFDSETYAEIVNRSDIILVPYNENNYYARSSGVFAEALVAGVPVIYPAKSWMGRELLDENRRYWKELASRLPGSSWTELPNPRKQEPDTDISESSILISTSVAPRRRTEQTGPREIVVSASTKNPVLFFRFNLLSAEPGRYLKVSVFETIRKTTPDGAIRKDRKLAGSIEIDLRHKEGTAMHLFDKPGSYTLALDLLPTSGANAISDPWTNITSFSYRLAESKDQVPRQTVGFAYDSIDRLSAAMEEIIAHYSHYESSSLAFAPGWRSFHCATNLVRILADVEG